MTYFEAWIKAINMNDRRRQEDIGKLLYHIDPSPHVMGEWIISELTNEEESNDE